MKIKLVSTGLFFTLFLATGLMAINKTPLINLINDCQKLVETSAEGTENGEYLTGSKQVLSGAITSATVILNSSSATQETLNLEVDNLFSAYTTFTKQRYGITAPNWSDNYWQFAGNSSQWGPYNLHDPAIIQADGYFYVFSTDAAWANSSKGIPVRRSRDLVNWEFRGWAFNGYPTEPSDWFKTQQPLAESKKAVNGLWAPYLIKVGTQYRLYYSAVFEGGGALIGLATSENIEGPWLQVGKVISTYDLANVNAIDPTVSIDKTGRHWMIYGSWSNGIYSFELDAATGLKKDNTAPKLIAQNGPNNSWDWKSCMEGPEVIYHPGFNKYYLFLAQGSLGNVYHTRVARANSPQGPYADYFGKSVIYSGTSPLFPEIYPLITYPYQFNNHPGWQGVSHVGVFKSGNDYFMMHQGRPSANAAMMVLHNRKITWTADGWPTVSPERYSNPGIMPAITPDSIVGNWEEIQLNEYKDPTGWTAGRVTPVLEDTASAWRFLCTPKITTYKNDGSFQIGTETGSWRLSGDTLISTRLAKTFKAIISYEYDWENNKPTLVYTGLRYDGRSIWGKKSAERSMKNSILNSTFDLGLQHWVIDKYGGEFTEQVVASGINGNSFNAKCVTSAGNYWNRQLRWLFPVAKCARYKVSFKAKASKASTLNFEIQDNASIIPIIRTSFNVGSSASTFTFITQDVPVTSNLYTLNIAYGTLAAGTELWIDDIILEEVTDRCTGNYITNGKFSDKTIGWELYKSTSFSGKIELDSVTKINHQPALHCQVINPGTNWSDGALKWSTHMHSGAKYVLEFNAKSSTGFDIVPRLLNGTTVISTASQIQLKGENSNYRFVFPELTEDGFYTLEIGFGKSAAASESWLSGFALTRCTANCSNTDINPVLANELTIFPVPAKKYFDIKSTQAVCEATIYSIDGKLLYSQKENNIRRVDIWLQSGSYIVKLKTANTQFSRKLSVE
jgi:arabinan endo-1,5-alpha-L-arabinosidase